MVDILLWETNKRYKGCRAQNYLLARDSLEGGKHPTKTKEDKRTAYEYPVKVVVDPLVVGGFKPGSSFSILEYETMLLQGTFTVGTTLMVERAMRFVHSRDNGCGQCVKKFKPKAD